MTILTAIHAPTKPFQTKALGLGHLFTVWSQRQALRKLDTDALNDIGLSSAQAAAESSRSFWDAPKTWRD
jgi:uncharacterized protein YjiS (DUF1127 family)